jgi:release factor glutamine methyltransferase
VTPEPALVATLRAAGCVFAEDEARLLGAAAADPAELARLVDRRVAGEPLEHLLGWAEFAGHRVAVGPGVFVPRRRTELLVDQATTLAAGRAGLVVVELCCGAGAVGAVLAATLDRIDLYAVDVDDTAVRYARRNLAGAGRVFQGDLDAPLPPTLAGRVDLLLANAPYVPSDAVALLPPEARDHEPRAALDGGPDGLDVLRRVVTAAPRWLAPAGHLLVEVAAGQAGELVAAAGRAGLAARVVSAPDRDATALVASRPS